jgi:hypothetical protein
VGVPEAAAPPLGELDGVGAGEGVPLGVGACTTPAT